MGRGSLPRDVQKPYGRFRQRMTAAWTATIARCLAVVSSERAGRFNPARRLSVLDAYSPRHDFNGRADTDDCAEFGAGRRRFNSAGQRLRNGRYGGYRHRICERIPCEVSAEESAPFIRGISWGGPPAAATPFAVSRRARLPSYFCPYSFPDGSDPCLRTGMR